ncbi:SRPBCC family protein [Nocardioides dilutus]
MTVIRNSVTLRCTPEQAFDYLSNLENELEWNPKVERMAKLTDGPVGLGTRFDAKWKSSPALVVEIVAFDRPRSWTAHNAGPIEVTFGGELEPVPAGTRLAVTFDARPHGWFRLVFPIFLLVIRREERANMAHIRRAVERRYASA